MVFTTPQQAIEVQTLLLEKGFKFYAGKQEPRQCYGVMWRDKEIRSAGNKEAFKAYPVPLVKEIGVRRQRENPTRPEKKVYTAEMRSAAAKYAKSVHTADIKVKVAALAIHVVQALKNIGEHEPNLYATNTRSQSRIAAWVALINEVIRLNGRIERKNHLIEALRSVLIEKKKPFNIPDTRHYAWDATRK